MENVLIPYDYKKAEAIAKRTEAFYEGPTGKALIHIRGCSDSGINYKKIKPLNAYKFPEDMETYLDLRAENDYLYSKFHERFDDDLIVSTCSWYGIAEHTAFLGGKVDFATDTSYNHQICQNSIDEYKNIKLCEDNLWVKLVSGGIKYINEKWGKYIPVRLRGADGPSDIANIVRGNELFYDIYDSPEELEGLMKFCADAMNFTLDLQRREATKINGGYVNGFCTWMKGKCIGHISEDFSTMLSPEIYEDYFFKHLEYAVKDGDSAYLHVHSLGHRMLPLFTKLEKIKIFELSSDPNSMRAVEVYRKYMKELENKTVCLMPSFEELLNMEDILERGKTIVYFEAKNEDEAKRAIEFVNKYR